MSPRYGNQVEKSVQAQQKKEKACRKAEAGKSRT
jgi:hypothetical protein